MDEDDFDLFGAGHADSKQSSRGKVDRKQGGTREISKLSKKERQKLLGKQHPELIPVVSYFMESIKSETDISKALGALMSAGDAAEVSTNPSR